MGKWKSCFSHKTELRSNQGLRQSVEYDDRDRVIYANDIYANLTGGDLDKRPYDTSTGCMIC